MGACQILLTDYLFFLSCVNHIGMSKACVLSYVSGFISVGEKQLGNVADMDDEPQHSANGLSDVCKWIIQFYVG